MRDPSLVKRKLTRDHPTVHTLSCAWRELGKRNIQYGRLARLVRGGGFRIALIALFSAIPSHCVSSFRFGGDTAAQISLFLVTTAVSATHGHQRVDIRHSRVQGLLSALASALVHAPAGETSPQRVASYLWLPSPRSSRSSPPGGILTANSIVPNFPVSRKARFVLPALSIIAFWDSTQHALLSRQTRRNSRDLSTTTMHRSTASQPELV